MKVLFLDFDGVLNTVNYQADLRGRGVCAYDSYGPLFDPRAVTNLKRVLDTVPDVCIVVNSSWKFEGMQRMLDLWRDRQMPGKLYDITPDFVPDLDNIDLEDDEMMAMRAGKGNEVAEWIQRNAPDGCAYAIVDDIPDFLPSQESHLVYTDPTLGLTEEDALKVIELLER